MQCFSACLVKYWLVHRSLDLNYQEIESPNVIKCTMISKRSNYFPKIEFFPSNYFLFIQDLFDGGSRQFVLQLCGPLV